MKETICVKCEEPFVLQPMKPGYANVCPECTAKNPPKEPPLKMAMVAWSGKHTPEITITDNRAQAKAFNAANARRSGYNACLPFSSQTPAIERLPGNGDRDNEVIGTEYRNRLGEARKVR